MVTSFTFKLHHIDTIYGGPMLYELSEAAAVMRWYRDFIKVAPDNLNGFLLFSLCRLRLLSPSIFT